MIDTSTLVQNISTWTEKEIDKKIDWATKEEKETGKKYVHSKWYDIECELLNEKLYNILGKEYRNDILLQDDGYMNNKNVIDMCVNWCALGKCNTEKTRNFIRILQEATKLAEDFKYNGYYLKYQIYIKTKEEGEALVNYYNEHSIHYMLTLKKEGEHYICIRSQKES